LDFFIQRENRDLSPNDGFASYQLINTSTTGGSTFFSPIARCKPVVTATLQGDQDFVLTPDLANNGSYDVNDPVLPLT
jgi:hypothetical protein